jgi:hypothetical protein
VTQLRESAGTTDPIPAALKHQFSAFLLVGRPSSASIGAHHDAFCDSNDDPGGRGDPSDQPTFGGPDFPIFGFRLPNCLSFVKT